ncbi:MAG: PBP1A family penicillin-binding protein [Bacteroidales bacterium]
MLIGLAIPAVTLAGVLGYYYVVFSRLVDARLHGERAHVLPRVYGRPIELRGGELMSERELIDRLNDLGYAQAARAARPGEFTIGGDAVTMVPRTGTLAGRVVRAVFRKPAVPAAKPGQPAPVPPAERLERLELVPGGPTPTATLDPPLLTALISTSREKRRQVPLAKIPKQVVQAVLAIEDSRYYEHPGVDPIGIIGAAITNMRGKKSYLSGGSTITQQLTRNVFLGSVLENPTERTRGWPIIRRKLLEVFMAMVLERRASKDEILELYLNEVYLGQRGSFGIHGVAEGARLFFGKDVFNLSLAEAATIAGVIHSPYNLSPFTNLDRSRDRRNVVLKQMADTGFIAPDAARQASAEPLTVVARALEAEAPYFVDLVGQTLSDQYATVMRSTQPVEVYTTLDLHLQRFAQDAVREGLAQVDQMLARRKRKATAQAALVAVDPRTGEILALVGGRFYNQSQYNRATSAKRQPGSVFKPFVYLSAFEKAAADGRNDMTPATVVTDEKTTFYYEDKTWDPGNYEGEYDGPVTLRYALAHSKNAATIKVAEMTGYDQVAALWKRFAPGTLAQAYPSIALGVFEATPFDIATAFTAFPNLGEVHPLRTITSIKVGSKEVPQAAGAKPRRVARADTTFLVLNMMRSVINEGTAASVRGAGFSLDAAGKTGTTNDLRDAWFVGFTPELLTVVWVGLDENQPLGLSGAQAALPIWTTFMLRALAGRQNVEFRVPDGIDFVDIDRDTGKLPLPSCPRIFREAFLAGTAPVQTCELHKY